MKKKHETHIQFYSHTVTIMIVLSSFILYSINNRIITIMILITIIDNSWLSIAKFVELCDKKK